MPQYRYTGTDCDFGKPIGLLRHGQLVNVPDEAKARMIQNPDEWEVQPANVQTDVDLALMDNIRRMDRPALLAACENAAKLDPSFRFSKKDDDEILMARLLRAVPVAPKELPPVEDPTMTEAVK